MGTYFTYGATKQDIIDEILKPLKEKNHLVVSKLTYGDDEPVLWTVEKGERDGQPYQFIGCYVLRQANGDWGYKPMDETMGPCFYSVPLEWMEKYPCIMLPADKGHSLSWRAEVTRDVFREILSAVPE